MSGTVSVIIPTYNRCDYLPQSLDSVLAQTVPAHEVLVVDDGSTDNTAGVVESYGAPVKLISQSNQGAPVAINRGVENAVGDYIWVFDDDDVAMPGFIEQQRSVLDSDRQLGFTFSDFQFARESDGELIPGDVYSPGDYSGRNILPRLMIGVFFRHTAMLTRRECYEQLGGLDPAFQRSYDYDFLIRVSHQYQGRHVPGVGMLFRVHEGERGAGQHRHTADERDRVHMEYDSAVLRKAVRNLPLETYVPDRDESKPLTRSQRREALLLRATAMARRAMWQEAIEDLFAAGEAYRPGEATEDRERQHARRTFAVPATWPVLLQSPAHRNRLLEFLRQPYARALRREFVAGLLTPGSRAVANREWTMAGRRVFDAMRMVGPIAVARGVLARLV